MAVAIVAAAVVGVAGRGADDLVCGLLCVASVVFLPTRGCVRVEVVLVVYVGVGGVSRVQVRRRRTVHR